MELLHRQRLVLSVWHFSFIDVIQELFSEPLLIWRLYKACHRWYIIILYSRTRTNLKGFHLLWLRRIIERCELLSVNILLTALFERTLWCFSFEVILQLLVQVLNWDHISTALLSVEITRLDWCNLLHFFIFIINLPLLIGSHGQVRLYPAARMSLLIVLILCLAHEISWSTELSFNFCLFHLFLLHALLNNFDMVVRVLLVTDKSTGVWACVLDRMVFRLKITQIAFVVTNWWEKLFSALCEVITKARVSSIP